MAHGPLFFFSSYSPKFEPLHEKTCFMPYPTTKAQTDKGTDQPAHLHSLISIFVVCRLHSMISMADQAGLSLTWSETQKTGFLVMWLI